MLVGKEFFDIYIYILLYIERQVVWVCWLLPFVLSFMFVGGVFLKKTFDREISARYFNPAKRLVF